MLNMVQADLYRIFHKKSNYIFFTTLFFLFTALMLTGFATSSDERLITPYLLSQSAGAAIQTGIILISVNSFLAVYFDDLSSGYLKHILSKSSNRISYIISKFITLLIYVFISYLIFAIIFYAEMYLFSKGFYSDITSYIDSIIYSFKVGIIGYTGTIIYTMSGAVVLYFTSRIEISSLWIVLYTTSAISQIFRLISFFIKPFSIFTDYFIDNLLINLMSEGANIRTVIFLFIHFIVIVFLQIFLMNSKELKFD